MVIWDKSQNTPWSDISITTGRYVFKFEIPYGKDAPIFTEHEISVGGKTYQVEKAYTENGFFYLVLNIHENPWPVALILATVLAAFTWLALVQIEKLSDSFPLIIVMLLIGTFLYLKTSGQSWKLS
jgi:hypothetical protein